MTDPIRVVIVDDHPMVVDGLTLALDLPGIVVVGSAASLAGASAVIDEARPDVVVLDVHLPDGSGIQAAATIRAQHPSTGLLVLTMSAADHHVAAAMAAGVQGYLLKGASREEIVRAVRAVADGQVILSAEVAVTAVRGQSRPSAFPTLTEREREILTLLGDGLDNPVIARRLNVSTKTVANHVSSILTKLQVADRTQAALLARGRH